MRFDIYQLAVVQAMLIPLSLPRMHAIFYAAYLPNIFLESAIDDALRKNN